MSELKEPKDYPKALILLQSVSITFYCTVACVIYYYVGSDVTSPALGAAPLKVKKIAYGLAIPTIIIAGVINGHIAAKYFYVKVYRDWFKQKEVVTQKTWKAFGSWAVICAILWIVAWLLAEAIPVFNQLLGLFSALFGTWFTCMSHRSGIAFNTD